MSTALGVYVHLPFCPYICPYCDFAKRPWRRSEATRYLSALRAELRAAPQGAAATVFFGGGTPNAYPPAELCALVREVRARFSLADGAETTVEANPGPALCEFAEYRAAGVNRLSIGVQSFEPAELRTLGRLHRPEDAREAVRRARQAGFENLSLDLMFGVPGQTRASWRRTLETAVALEPEHISTYGLTVEEGTPFWDWREREPQAFCSSDDEAELYEMAIELLGEHGYEHYEISNFARPQRRCAHNQNYWRNGDYVGLGLGAASFEDGVRRASTRDFERYCETALAGRAIPSEEERLEGASRLGEAAMLSLRTADGVNLREFELRYGQNFLLHFATVVESMRSAGLLEVEEARVGLTQRGRFLANDVCGAFVTYTP